MVRNSTPERVDDAVVEWGSGGLATASRSTGGDPLAIERILTYPPSAASRERGVGR